jgi:hypothetical protein
MAYEESLRSVSLDADASIGIYTGVPGTIGAANPNSGKQFYWVKVTGERIVGLCSQAVGENPLGILQNKPQQVGGAAQVGFSGITKAVAGTGGFTAGARVGPAADGTTVAYATGTGIAITSAVAGAVGNIMLGVV